MLFVQALIDSGHTIEICPRSTITTFGIAACVKEDDGSWSNIPVAFFFRTGYENRDGRPAYFSAPHGGLSLSIQGPLLGKDKRCDIQYYVAIDGLCGWHSDHNPDAPWLKPVSTTDIYNPEQTLHAVRMAGLLGVTFNGIATEMNLPFGGYGVLGVCNDSAAIVDFALRGETIVGLARGFSQTCWVGNGHEGFRTIGDGGLQYGQRHSQFAGALDWGHTTLSRQQPRLVFSADRG
jgi:hypothetical protein